MKPLLWTKALAISLPLAFAGLACNTAVYAQSPSNGLPLWEVGVAAGAVSTPAYPASESRTQRGLVLPLFIYRGEVLRADRGGIGARVVHEDNYELDVGFAASLPASSNDVAARQGMPDLGTLIEFGPRMKISLARPAPGSQVRLELPLRTVLEINGGVRNQGLAFEPTLVHETRDVGYGWGLGLSAGLMFGDQRLNQYFYGVEAPYVTASRPRYDAQSGLIATRLGVSTFKSLSPDVRIFGFVRYESYRGAANMDSPLYLASQGTSAGIGLTWTLGRSQERAKD